jgi:N-acetylglutamate synthase-like GNAT family acetyltransferase
MQSMMKPVIEIRPYRAGDGTAFREMNEDWIAKNFGIEEKDRQTLGDPEKYILQQGGHIFMAASGTEAVGCCALLLLRPRVYEVAKMTVAEAYRGQGLGRRLLAYTIAQGKALGAESLYLETNKKLGDAIHLYEALGFRHLPPERVVPSPYERANVFMELVF